MLRHSLSEGDLKNIRSEIDLLKRLNHKQIVKYIDFVETENHLNIILEYIESGSLSHLIKYHGTLEENLASYYTRQVLLGLRYLHEQGIVHRDIKGANILLTKEGIVKLADFGLAIKLNEETQNHTSVGTPYWMAPEMMDGEGNRTSACDIWSVGCTVIELLTGNPPYHDLEQYPAMFRIYEDDHPPIPAGLSEEAESFLLTCFEKNPENRIKAPALLKHAWILKYTQKMEDALVASLHENLTKKSSFLSTSKLRESFQGGNDNMGALEGPDLHFQSQLLASNCLKQQDQMPPRIQHSASMIKRKSRAEQLIETNLKSRPYSPRALQHDLSQARYYQTENNLNIYDFKGVQSSELLLEVEDLKVNSKGEQVGSEDDDYMLESAHIQNKTDLKIQNEISELFSRLNYFLIEEKFMESKEILSVVSSLCMVLKKYPQVRQEIFEKQDLHIIIEVLEEFINNDRIVLACLEFFNNIVERDEQLVVQACKLGLIDVFSRFLQGSNHASIKVEAAYFLGNVVSLSKRTKELFINCGGLQSFNSIFDITQIDHTELIILGIECLVVLLDDSHLEVFHILEMTKEYLIEKLLCVIDHYSKVGDQQSELLVIKSLDCFLILSEIDNLRLRRRLSEKKVVEVLQFFLRRYEENIQLLRKLVRIFRNICTEPITQRRLEVQGLIPLLIRMIFVHFKKDNEVNLDILEDMLTTLHLMIKLSFERQEQVQVCGGVELLVRLANCRHIELAETALSVLCCLLKGADKKSAELTKSMQKAATLETFTKYMDEGRSLPRIFDALHDWYLAKPSLIIKTLGSDPLLSIFLRELASSSPPEFQKVVRILKHFLNDSPELCAAFISKKEFFEELGSRLESAEHDGDNGQVLQKDILEIVYNACKVTRDYKRLLEDFNIYKSVLNILHASRNNEKVILEEISTRLIGLYAQEPEPVRRYQN